MASLKSIKDFLGNKDIAVIGASSNKRKFGYIVLTSLSEKKYNTFPVNPKLSDINGISCFKDIASLPPSVKAAVFITKPEITEEITKQICKDGVIRHIWYQQGSESKEAVEIAKASGINLIHGICILMHIKPHGFPHNIHKFFVKLFGAFPK